MRARVISTENLGTLSRSRALVVWGLGEEVSRLLCTPGIAVCAGCVMCPNTVFTLFRRHVFCEDWGMASV